MLELSVYTNSHMGKGYTGKIYGCDCTKSNADLFIRGVLGARKLGKPPEDTFFPSHTYKPRTLHDTDFGFIRSSSPTTKRAGRGGDGT